MRSVVLGVAIFAAACDAGRAPVPAARPLVSPTRDASLLVAAPRDASLLTSHAAITGCEERPTPPPTAACAAPPADVVKRATALVAASSAPDGGEPTIRFGCELSSGWLVDANFFPSPAFHDGIEPPCPPAAGYCGVDATWILPPSGDARLLRGAVLDANLDVDGDGVAESVTHADGITTVWFDAGRKPVRLTHAGGLVPWQRGYVLADLDGDTTHGFVRASAHVYRVEPAGVTERDDIASAMWASTVAARCPVAHVIAIDPTLPAAPPQPLPACSGPAGAQKQISDAVVSRIGARGTQITDGPPDFQWSCNRRDPFVVVTYCEGQAINACGDEHGTWIYELWSARGAPALLGRTASGSEHMEWAVITTVGIATELDLDGDGAPDPIIESVSHEGGATRSQVQLEAYLGGKLVPVTQLDVRDVAFETVRPTGATADSLVVREAETHAASLWTFAGGRMQSRTWPSR